MKELNKLGVDLSNIINQPGEKFTDGEIIDQIVDYLKKENLYVDPKTVKELKVKDIMPFVLFNEQVIGITKGGTTAAQAWLISDELFNSIQGQKFSWISPELNNFVDPVENFKRPTEEQIIKLISPQLLKYCKQEGYIV